MAKTFSRTIVVDGTVVKVENIRDTYTFSGKGMWGRVKNATSEGQAIDAFTRKVRKERAVRQSQKEARKFKLMLQQERDHERWLQEDW